MRLILIRHTRPAVGDNLCYGVTDVDVAPTFEQEAARVVASLPAVERLVTSPLRRCTRLAERIGAARGLVPAVDERLREMDFGRWEGLSWEAVERVELDAWAADFFHARPHGGESVRMVVERVGAALADIGRSGVAHALVTHGGIIKVARAFVGDADAWTERVDFGAMVEMETLVDLDMVRFNSGDRGSWN
ncbi:MAG: alpha-ribazole phosphatase family protein [Deltaproteobacteria bacterium]|nr:alpha-ribazole phosphatase family protein [Deltaproteobacteria bacterium]